MAQESGHLKDSGESKVVAGLATAHANAVNQQVSNNV